MQEFYNEQMFTVSSKDDDPIEALVRRGAKVMLQAALEQEVSQYLERARHQQSEDQAQFRGASQRLLERAKVNGWQRDN